MSLKPVPRSSLSDAVFEQLSTEIVQGRLAPGAALPSERALSGILKVNRGAVREALKRLAQAGLISIQQGEGTRVLNFRRTGSLDLLARLLFKADATIDLKVARSVMEIRAVMAPDIARLCARRATPEIVEQLAATVTNMERQAQELSALQTLALEFWDLLVSGSDNIAYELAFNSLRHTYEQLLSEALVEILADEIRDVTSYRAIADAVGRGDDLSATHIAKALVERGTRGVFELIAAIERSQDVPVPKKNSTGASS